MFYSSFTPLHRTFDIQCLNQKDYNLLQINLTILVTGERENSELLSDPANYHSVNSSTTGQPDSPLKSSLSAKSGKGGSGKGSATPGKKTVRFSFGDLDCEVSLCLCAATYVAQCLL